EPAKIFRAVIAYDNNVTPEQLAKRVIGRAALCHFRRNPPLPLLQEDPVKLVIFTHRSQQWAAVNCKPQNNIKMVNGRAFRHPHRMTPGRPSPLREAVHCPTFSQKAWTFCPCG